MRVFSFATNHPRTVIKGPPRTKIQIDTRRGALFGEAQGGANKELVFYGLLRDPALATLTGGSTDLAQNGDEAGPQTGGETTEGILVCDERTGRCSLYSA